MNEFKVGLLALAAIGSVIFMSFKITSNQSGFGDYKSYRTVIKDASGIFPKTPIKVAGINAGRIKEIELENNAALITFEVLAKVRISKGSKLKVKSVGFLGDKYLEISLAPDTETLSENSYIDSEEGAGMERLMKDASEVITDIKKITSNLQTSLAPEGKESPISKIVEDMKVMSSNARSVTESLKKMITGNEDKIHKLIANLEKFSEQIKDESDKNKDKSIAYELSGILANTKKATEDLKQMMADVKSGKGTIGKFLVEEEIADKVSQTLSSVNRLVNAFNSIRTEVNAFSGVNTDYGADTRAQVRIFPTPEKFYLIGISTSEFGPDKGRQTITNIDGVESKKTETYRDKFAYRFDVQMGRKIQNFTFRGGLIESTGGLGVDYLVQKWGTTFTAELFDYRDSVGKPNLRLSSEVRIWNVFYTKLMAEDMVVDETRSYSILAGIKFSDEDLRSLLAIFL